MSALSSTLSQRFYTTPIGQIIEIKQSKDDNLYAMSVDGDGHRKYLGMPGNLELTRMAVDKVAAWGLATGRCLICRRTLTVKESIERGIGPVCYAGLV